MNYSLAKNFVNKYNLSNSLLKWITLLILFIYLATFLGIVLLDSNSFYIAVDRLKPNWMRQEILLYKGNPTIRSWILRPELVCGTGLYSDDLDPHIQDILNSGSGFLTLNPDQFVEIVKNIDLKINLAIGKQDARSLFKILQEYLKDTQNDHSKEIDKIINTIVILGRMNNQILEDLSKLSLREEFEVGASALEILLRSQYNSENVSMALDFWSTNTTPQMRILSTKFPGLLYRLSASDQNKSNYVTSILENNDHKTLLVVLLSLEQMINQKKFVCEDETFTYIVKRLSAYGISQEEYLRNYSEDFWKIRERLISVISAAISNCRNFFPYNLLATLKDILDNPNQPEYKRDIAADIIGTLLHFQPQLLSKFLKDDYNKSALLDIRLRLQIVSQALVWNDEVSRLIQFAYFIPEIKYDALSVLSKLFPSSPDAEKLLTNYLKDLTSSEIVNVFSSFHSLYTLERVLQSRNVIKILEDKIERDSSGSLIPFYFYALKTFNPRLLINYSKLKEYFFKASSSNDEMIILSIIAEKLNYLNDPNLNNFVKSLPFSEVLEILHSYCKRHNFSKSGDLMRLNLGWSFYDVNLRATLQILKQFDFYKNFYSLSSKSKEKDEKVESIFRLRIAGIDRPYIDPFASQLIAAIGKDTLYAFEELYFAIDSGRTQEAKFEAVIALGKLYPYTAFIYNSSEATEKIIEYTSAKDSSLSKAARYVLKSSFKSWRMRIDLETYLQKLDDPILNRKSVYRYAFISAIEEFYSDNDLLTLKEHLRKKKYPWHLESAYNQILYRFNSTQQPF